MTGAYQTLYDIVLPILGLALLGCLARAVIGPRIADRVIAINMMGSLSIIIICVLALAMEEGYLADIALVYAMLSFLAVVLLTKIYIGVYIGHKSHKGKEGAAHDDP